MTKIFNYVPTWGVNFLQKHGQRKGITVKRVPIRGRKNSFTVTIEANNNARNDMDGLQLVQAFVLFQNETNRAIQDAWTWDLVEQEDISLMVEDRLRDTVQFRRLNK